MRLPTRVYVPRGDGHNWALDEDRSLIRAAIGDTATETPLDDADVVLSVWWGPLKDIPRHKLAGKRVICHITGDLEWLGRKAEFYRVKDVVGLWIARTRRAARQLADASMPHVVIPYTVDTTVFRPLSPAVRQEVLGRWRIPSDRFLIASFQRDSQGGRLNSPKLVKGPDIFLDIVHRVHRMGLPVHVVLAGPRRHWLLGELERAGIPHTYCGTPTSDDDLTRNALPRPLLNELYNVSDLYVVASRSEGGPHAILEAAAARCPIISRPVGMAEDVLDPQCIFDTAEQAVAMIERHFRERHLAATVGRHQQVAVTCHSPGAVSAAYASLLSREMAPLVLSPREHIHSRWQLLAERMEMHFRRAGRIVRRARPGGNSRLRRRLPVGNGRDAR